MENNPNDICQCGHKRSEHLDGETCVALPFAGEDDGCGCVLFQLDPNAHASGHNPDQLTQAQVGIVEGWRLLEEDELVPNEMWRLNVIQACKRYNDGVLQGWHSGPWHADGSPESLKWTYRTRLTRAELRAARSLPAEPAPESEQMDNCKYCGCALMTSVDGLDACAACMMHEQTLSGSAEAQCAVAVNPTLKPATASPDNIGGTTDLTPPLKSSEVPSADSGGKTPEQNIWRRDGYHGDNFLDLYFLKVGVAKACGWYLIEPPAEDGTFGFSLRHPTKTTMYPWWCTEERAWADAPDFPASLDAMAVAEATLTDEEYDRFSYFLEELVSEEWGRVNPRFNSATAMQRARAFLAVKGAE